MIDRENVLKLAAQVEQSDTFDMSDWGSCLLAEARKLTGNVDDNTRDLVEWLGFPDDRHYAFALCAPEPSMLPNAIELYEITREHAARMLRHLADTGKIDWKVTATG